MNDVKETIEWVKHKIHNYERAENYYRGRGESIPKDTTEPKAFFENILQSLQSIAEAEKELGEEKTIVKHFYFSVEREDNYQRIGSNEMRAKALPIIARHKIESKEKDGRIEEEKKTRIKYQDIVYKICSLFDTRQAKTTIDVVVDKVEELQSAKSKIEELEKACNIKDASIETSLKMYRNLEEELQSLRNYCTLTFGESHPERIGGIGDEKIR